MNGSELLLVRLCVACEQLELLAKAASCISYCSCRSSSVKIIAACAVPRPMILGGDDGEQLMAVTTKESIEADCWLTDARILDRATFRRAYPWTKHNREFR